MSSLNTGIAMMEGSDLKAEPAKKNIATQAWIRLSQIYQSSLDRWTPHTKGRWFGSFLLLCLFILRIVSMQSYNGMLDATTPHMKVRWGAAFLILCAFVGRILYAQGWYIVTYALGIYHLNLFIAFLTPKIDPAMDFDAEDDSGPALPTRASEEFRPFIRRLPEFKFWLSVTKSTLIAFICTFFDCFNIPVFWPILVMYFLTLMCITMKRQIKHMIKYRYIPFTHSKPKYRQVDPVEN